MKKIIIFSILAILLFLGIFYFQFQTYFIDQEVLDVLPEEVVSTEPNMVKKGNFVDSDFIHKGTGDVYVIEYPDGRKIVRLENLDVTNGPDLYLYVSDSKNPKENLGNYVDLGRLKGNMGNQNYDIPETNVEINSVVIWCEKFGVLFPYAVLNQN